MIKNRTVFFLKKLYCDLWVFPLWIFQFQFKLPKNSKIKRKEIKPKIWHTIFLFVLKTLAVRGKFLWSSLFFLYDLVQLWWWCYYLELGLSFLSSFFFLFFFLSFLFFFFFFCLFFSFFFFFFGGLWNFFWGIE